MIKRSKTCVFFTYLIFVFSVFAFFIPVNNFKISFAKSSETSAKAMMVLEKSSLRPLYYYNENERLPMASTTKIITAIYVIEHSKDLDKKYEIPKEATNIEGTKIYLKQGEHLTIRELLYGLMLRSGNDAAVALAIIISGSQEQFVEDVNEFLKVNGFENTHLSNPHGLPDDNHYTTASDLARITAYVLENETFKEIVGTKQKEISNELNVKASRNLINKNKLLKNYEYATGVKTGYTRKAGRCFVGSAEKDGMEVICVLLNCNPMFEEAKTLLDKAFNEFKLYKLVSKEDKLADINIESSKQKNISIYTSEDFYYPLKHSELKDIDMVIETEKSMKAPIKKGKEIATIKITHENQLIFSEKIATIENIESNSLGSTIGKVIEYM